MPSAEIITIGTEILLGEIVDTNTRYIARHLRNLGVDLYRTITIGDNLERIAEAIRASMSHAEIVITTGGLGPTVDDPTRDAVARAIGVESEYRPELWEQIIARLARYGRTPSENQKRQAYIPQGAIGVENPVGTAPSFIVETDRNALISLPGVPREMEYLLETAVIPYLQKRFDLHQVIKVRLLHTSGIGESLIDEQVGDFEKLTNPTVGLAAHSGIVDIRIAAKADTQAEADRMIAEIESETRIRLGRVIFGADEDTLEGVTLQMVANRGWNLVALESGLDGALIRRLTNPQNRTLLGVDSRELDRNQLVPILEETRKKHGAKAALGIAAFIGEELVVEQCILTPQGLQNRTLTYGGHPGNVPRWAVNLGLDWLRLMASESDG
jgi:competence/damage-inducible protein CinA-like protein